MEGGDWAEEGGGVYLQKQDEIELFPNFPFLAVKPFSQRKSCFILKKRVELNRGQNSTNSSPTYSSRWGPFQEILRAQRSLKTADLDCLLE